jgi:oligosaccharyltransferase complex subunit beta
VIGRGFSLTFESPKTEGLSLFHLGLKAYDHVLLLPPKSKAYGPALTPNLLLDFLKANGNILLGLSANSPVPSGIVSLLLEVDIHLPTDKGSAVIDHFNYDESASEQHDILLVQPPKPIREDVKNFFGSTGKANNHAIAVPHAVGQVLGASSQLLLPILKAPSTAYIANPKEESVEDLFASGSQISLVSAHQARNSARLTVLGSVETLQDTYFDESKFGNKLFAEQVSAWTFKELGVLKVGRFQHWLNEGSKGGVNSTEVGLDDLNPTIYRVKNDVVRPSTFSTH